MGASYHTRTAAGAMRRAAVYICFTSSRSNSIVKSFKSTDSNGRVLAVFPGLKGSGSEFAESASPIWSLIAGGCGSSEGKAGSSSAYVTMGSTAERNITLTNFLACCLGPACMYIKRSAIQLRPITHCSATTVSSLRPVAHLESLHEPAQLHMHQAHARPLRRAASSLFQAGLHGAKKQQR